MFLLAHCLPIVVFYSHFFLYYGSFGLGQTKMSVSQTRRPFKQN